MGKEEIYRELAKAEQAEIESRIKAKESEKTEEPVEEKETEEPE